MRLLEGLRKSERVEVVGEEDVGSDFPVNSVPEFLRDGADIYLVGNPARFEQRDELCDDFVSDVFELANDLAVGREVVILFLAISRSSLPASKPGSSKYRLSRNFATGDAIAAARISII